MKVAAPLNIAIWRPVSVSVHQWRAQIANMRPVSTRRISSRRFGMERGESIWSCDSTCGPLSIYFEWVEINLGVVALADPMGVFSNACLTEDEDGTVAVRDSTVELNSALFLMDWQTGVCEFLKKHRDLRAHRQSFGNVAAMNSRQPAIKPAAGNRFAAEQIEMGLRQAA